MCCLADEVQVSFEGAKASLEQTKGTLAKTDAAYKQTQETLKVVEKDLRTVYVLVQELLMTRVYCITKSPLHIKLFSF